MDILFILLVLVALHFGHIFTAVGLAMLFVSISTVHVRKEVKLCAMVTYKALSDFKKQLGELNDEMTRLRDELRRERRG
jgi:hypothetical protein